MIHDVNRPMLHAMLSKAWIDVRDLGICANVPVRLAQVLKRAEADSDIIVTSGGAFGSDEDHIGDVIADLGGEVWRHRVAIKAGKAPYHRTFEEHSACASRQSGSSDDQFHAFRPTVARGD